MLSPTCWRIRSLSISRGWDRAFKSITGMSPVNLYSHLTIYMVLNVKRMRSVARQDAFGSVPARQVEAIDKKIREIVLDIDPNEQILSTLYSDTDIKIFIKAESGGFFDKGHGLNLLVEHTKCDLHQGPILVCGDSGTRPTILN